MQYPLDSEWLLGLSVNFQIWLMREQTWSSSFRSRRVSAIAFLRPFTRILAAFITRCCLSIHSVLDSVMPHSSSGLSLLLCFPEMATNEVCEDDGHLTVDAVRLVLIIGMGTTVCIIGEPPTAAPYSSTDRTSWASSATSNMSLKGVGKAIEAETTFEIVFLGSPCSLICHCPNLWGRGSLNYRLLLFLVLMPRGMIEDRWEVTAWLAVSASIFINYKSKEVTTHRKIQASFRRSSHCCRFLIFWRESVTTSALHIFIGIVLNTLLLMSFSRLEYRSTNLLYLFLLAFFDIFVEICFMVSLRLLKELHLLFICSQWIQF